MKEEWTKDQVFLTKDEVKKLLPKRKRESNKGDYGRTVIVGGSKRYGGAAYLSALAALRSGVGYTTLCVPEGLQAGYFLRLPEALLETVSGEDELRFHQAEFKKLCVYDSIAYGMGLGMSEDVAMGVEYLLEKYQGKLILDADGINSLQLLEKERLDELFKNKKCDVIITPHVKEFSRITGKSVEEILENPLKHATDFASEKQITVLLKGHVSVITDGRKTLINERGCSGQAKGGSGDVLSGVIAGVAAQGVSLFEAGASAAYLVGNAAEIGAKEWSDYSLLPRDVVEFLGKSFLEISN